MAYSQEDRQRVGATRARQGRMGRNIFWVLVFGVALTILGFAATWAWKAGDFARTEPNGGASRANATSSSTYAAPRPDAATRQNYQKGGPLAPQNGGNPPSQ